MLIGSASREEVGKTKQTARFQRQLFNIHEQLRWIFNQLNRKHQEWWNKICFEQIFRAQKNISATLKEENSSSQIVKINCKELKLWLAATSNSVNATHDNVLKWVVEKD